MSSANVPYGVYIGQDMEAVVTDKYTLLFRRKGEEYLESFLLLTDTMKCIGICQSTPCGTSLSSLIGDCRFALQSEAIVANNDDMRQMLGSTPVALAWHGDNLTATLYDGTIYRAAAGEHFSMEELSAPCDSATQDNVAQCLREWNKTVKDIVWKGSFLGAIINTQKHMYIFEITADSVYCRAARYAVCDEGVAFDQNCRQGYASFMLADNTEAMRPLAVDPALFRTDACAWNSQTVYWSVANIESDVITLNGCNGDVYKWERPKR